MTLDAVLLIAFGGPTAPDEIRPFLELVARGRRIPPERLEEGAHHYERMPGRRSPLTQRTLAPAPGAERGAAGRGPERLEDAAPHSERMRGGRSPLTERTLAQAQALERALAERGPALPVCVGMRNWHPFLHETLAAMAGRGHKHALGIILSPFRAAAPWDRYKADIAGARARTPGAPEVG